jgi:phage terminase large subunit-like protein
MVKDPRVHTVRGSTYDNLHNLAPTFQRAVLDRYEGTTLGRQELHADILEDLPGALLRRADIDRARVHETPDLDLVVVAVDPAGTGTGDEAGIVVVGRGTADGHAYVLADYSDQMTARETGRKAWAALDEHEADALVYEDNFGKQWLRDGLLDAYPGPDYEAHSKLRKVTAQHGKHLRAQPVAMRYEQGKVHHVGVHPELEDQACTWNPHEDSDSPDRVDALVHGVTFLLRREKGTARVASPHAVGLGVAQGLSTIPRIGGTPWRR